MSQGLVGAPKITKHKSTCKTKLKRGTEVAAEEEQKPNPRKAKPQKSRTQGSSRSYLGEGGGAPRAPGAGVGRRGAARPAPPALPRCLCPGPCLPQSAPAALTNSGRKHRGVEQSTSPALLEIFSVLESSGHPNLFKRIRGFMALGQPNTNTLLLEIAMLY